MRDAEARADRETLAYAKLEDQVGNAEVEDRMYAGRLAQIEELLGTCAAALDARTSDKERAEGSLATARESALSLSGSIPALEDGLAAARKRDAEARDKLSASEATLAALRSVDAEVEAASPLAAALALEQALARIERRAENAATVGKDAGAVGRDEGEPGPRSVCCEGVADGGDETDIAQKGGYKRRCVLIDLHTIDESLSGNTVCHTASQGLGEGYDGSPSRHISER